MKPKYIYFAIFLLVAILLLFLIINQTSKTRKENSSEAKNSGVAVKNTENDTLVAKTPPDTLKITLVSDSKIMEHHASTGGVTFVDFDNDGDDDVFVTNGYDVSQSEPSPQVNIFYENVNGIFQEIELGFSEHMAYSSGSAWADMNNDGYYDLFVPNQRGQDNFLYKNKGGRSFDLLEKALPSTNGGASFSSSWGDLDSDGFVELFVANGGLTRLEKDFLYKNNRGKSFELLSSSPVVEKEQQSGGGTFVDYDLDGDLDLFVAGRPIRMYKNTGSGKLELDQTPLFVKESSSGISFSGAWGDFDNDGDFDLFQAYNHSDANRLYINEGNGWFKKCDCGELTSEVSSAFHSFWVDLNNDSYLDLVIANWGGFPKFYLNEKGQSFSRVILSKNSRRIWHPSMVAASDYDLDGDYDLVVGNWPGKPGEGEKNLLYRNDEAEGQFVALRLKGTQSNRSAIGARVELTFQDEEGSHTITREVRSQDGWRSQSSFELIFGLGHATEITGATIYWPSGIVQNIHSLNLGKRHLIIELK